MMKKIVSTELAPSAIGPYNQAVKYNRTVYVSGQLGLNPKTMEFASDEISGQSHQALKNLGEILKAAGTSYEKLLKTTVYLKNINDFAAFNKIYEEYVPKPYPARAVFEVANLPKFGLVEVEAIAACEDE